VLKSTLLVVLMIFLSSLGSYAQDITPVMSQEEVISLIDSVYKAPAQKFLLKQLDKLDGPSLHVVYVHNDNRYTLDYYQQTGGIWVYTRPNGTSNPDLVETVHDENTDGIADPVLASFDAIEQALGVDAADQKRLEFQSQQGGLQELYNKALIGLRATTR
jgi:hypothetical protein